MEEPILMSIVDILDRLKAVSLEVNASSGEKTSNARA
jgi:hypothetical protein